MLKKFKTYIKNFMKKCMCPGAGGGGDSHMKGGKMLVVSLRGVNFAFCSHLGCSGQNAIIFSCEGLVYGCTRKVTLFFTCLCFKVVSFRGLKKFGPCPDWSPSGV